MFGVQAVSCSGRGSGDSPNVLSLAVALVGLAWLSRISVDFGYLTQVAPPMVLIGIGMGAAFAPLTSPGIAGVADHVPTAITTSGVLVALALLVTLTVMRPSHAIAASPQAETAA